jgi:hypothetical protein
LFVGWLVRGLVVVGGCWWRGCEDGVFERVVVFEGGG